jgi:DNA (cytosine-5)-methyltransferase 1
MKIVSFFSAPGGLDLGLKQAGHEIIWACDIDKDAVETYKQNIHKNIVLGNIQEIPSKSIPEGDALVGGFPCLGFTIANLMRRKNDPRNLLYLEMVRYLRNKQPPILVAENVPGILSLAKGEAIQAIMKDFTDAGYQVKYRILHAADYGVPQKRRRVIFLGVRKDLTDKIQLDYPKPTHSRNDGDALEKWRTLKDAIGDITDDSKLPNHIGTNHKVKITGFLGNRKLKWDEPSPTIMGRGSRTGGPVIHPHPKLHRRLTIRECARIQTFPDNFIFFGSVSSQFKQVGDAVPPLLAFNIGKVLPKKI